MKPFFIWACGKTRLLKHYAPHWPKDVKTYSEPFFGGGAVFIYMVNNYALDEVWINDVNKDLIRIYNSIQNECDSFIKIVNRYELKYIQLDGPTKENTYKDEDTKVRHHCDRWKYFMEVRHEHAFDYKKWTSVEESATLYFLMKVGFNGIYQLNKNTNNRYGTPPGLMNQKDKVYDKDNVLEWHHALNSTKVNLSSKDWSEVPLGDFTFYDPPYRGSFTSYGTSFPDSETTKLIEVTKNNDNVWLTNRDIGDGFFDDIAGCDKISFDVTYTAGRRKKHEDGTFTAKKATEILLKKALTNP